MSSNTNTNARTSAQDVMIPEPRKETRKTRTVLVEINSRDRNISLYPQSSVFRWKLFRSLKNVVQIQIAGGSIPSCMYNINTGWNSFVFQESTTQYTVTLPPGRYSLQELVKQLAQSLNTLAGIANTYVIEISPITGRMTIRRTAGTSPFTLLFKSGQYADEYDVNKCLRKINNPSHLLGFGFADYSDNGTGSITGTAGVDLETILSRTYVYINHESVQDFNTIERSSGRLQPHAILYMDGTYSGYKFLNKETFQPIFFAFPAPIARVATLDVALRDEFDRPVDLNGRDFTLLLEISYLD
jgi:hypothetical protein